MSFEDSYDTLIEKSFGSFLNYDKIVNVEWPEIEN
jgi:hypothetical protein